jgi:hypothetical protein
MTQILLVGPQPKVPAYARLESTRPLAALFVLAYVPLVHTHRQLLPPALIVLLESSLGLQEVLPRAHALAAKQESSTNLQGRVHAHTALLESSRLPGSPSAHLVTLESTGKPTGSPTLLPSLLTPSSLPTFSELVPQMTIALIVTLVCLLHKEAPPAPFCAHQVLTPLSVPHALIAIQGSSTSIQVR